jgi:hypothetical protein
MKKINILILFSFLTTLSIAQATKTPTNKYRLGFKVSPNVSWLASDNSNMTVGDKSLQFGYGLNFDIFFAENYAIGTGFNINNTGSTFSYFKKFENGDDIEINTGAAINGMTQIGEVNRALTLKYIQIPFTFKMKTNEIGYITYWGQFGLGLNMNMKALSNDEIDFLTYQSYDGSGSLSTWETSSRLSENLTKVDIKDDVNIFAANLIFAAGIEYNLSGNTSLLGGLTFQNGFTDVLRSEGVMKKQGTDSPLINSDFSPAMYKLSGLPNYVELNIGILF